jgi:hypothetical protein
VLYCKLDKNPIIILKIQASLFVLAHDKIFEMRVKNLISVSDQINQPPYILINEKKLSDLFNSKS